MLYTENPGEFMVWRCQDVRLSNVEYVNIIAHTCSIRRRIVTAVYGEEVALAHSRFK